MSNPIGKPETFSFSQMNRIVEAYQGKPSKAADTEKTLDVKSAISDKLSLGEEKQDVLIMPGKNLMKSFTKIDADSVAEYLKGKGVEVEEKLNLVNGVAAKIDSKSMEELKEQGYMVYDNSPRNMLPNIPSITMADVQTGGKPWDMPKIEDVKWTGMETLHKEGITGKGKTIAVIDSGYEHPDVPLKAWKDVVEGSREPVDPNGHGTHVAGDAKKMAPDAELVGIRVMNSEGQGRPSDIVKGLQWAINKKEELGIDVINMSLGGAPDGYPYYLDPINQAVKQAVDSGIVVVAAAGNSGPEPSTIGSPADSPSAVAVGSALNPTTVSDFSSRGPTDDGFESPNIVAPGEYITSWAVPGSQMDQIATTVETLRRMTPEQLRKLFVMKPDLIKALGLPKNILENNDADLEKNVKLRLPPMHKPTPDTIAGPGTSFASPEVAGIVAGLRQAHPSAFPEKIKEAMMKTADNMGSQYGRMDQGAGFVRADKAHIELSS